jgi:hypothetical protein
MIPLISAQLRPLLTTLGDSHVITGTFPLRTLRVNRLPGRPATRHRTGKSCDRCQLGKTVHFTRCSSDLTATLHSSDPGDGSHAGGPRYL